MIDTFFIYPDCFSCILTQWISCQPRRDVPTHQGDENVSHACLLSVCSLNCLLVGEWSRLSWGGQAVSDRDVCARRPHPSTTTWWSTCPAALRGRLRTTLRGGPRASILRLPKHPRPPASHLPRGCDQRAGVPTHCCPVSPVRRSVFTAFASGFFLTLQRALPVSSRRLICAKH